MIINTKQLKVHVFIELYIYRFFDINRRKSRSRKTEVMKKKTYDGREVTFITENTQTDWDWLEEAEKSGKARLLGPRDSKSKKLTGFPTLLGQGF